MGEPTRPQLPMRLPTTQSTSEDDRSRPMCRRGSRRPPSPRSFGVAITPSEFRKTARTFARDQRTKTIADQRSTLLRAGHPLRRCHQLLIEIDCRTHVSTSSDASMVHHMMHIPVTCASNCNVDYFERHFTASPRHSVLFQQLCFQLTLLFSSHAIFTTASAPSFPASTFIFCFAASTDGEEPTWRAQEIPVTSLRISNSRVGFASTSSTAAAARRIVGS